MDEWLYLASKQKEYCVFPSFCPFFLYHIGRYVGYPNWYRIGTGLKDPV